MAEVIIRYKRLDSLPSRWSAVLRLAWLRAWLTFVDLPDDPEWPS